MDGTTVQKIVELAEVKRHQIEEREYATETLHLVAPPLVARMQVGTLTGLTDYLAANPDGLALDDLIVHVVSPTAVHLITSKPNVYRQRELFVAAECKPRVFPFGQQMAVEEFIIALQTYFVASKVTAEIQALVSNIKDDGSITYADNGLTQQVTAKTGIVAVGNVKVPNPVTLAPYRTFLEVEQPESRSKSSPGCHVGRSSGLAANYAGRSDFTRLVITCVDTVEARKHYRGCGPWLDLGNGVETGQAIYGTSCIAKAIRAEIQTWDKTPHVGALPDPYVVAGMAKLKGTKKKAPSCADTPFAEQGVFANEWAAQAGLTIIHQLLIKGELVTPAIYFDTAKGRMAPEFITREYVGQRG
jgi:hypothetical protein